MQTKEKVLFLSNVATGDLLVAVSRLAVMPKWCSQQADNLKFKIGCSIQDNCSQEPGDKHLFRLLIF
jgi:hypothetical protein